MRLIVPKFETYDQFLAWFAERAQARLMEGEPTHLGRLKDGGWIADYEHSSTFGDVLRAIRRTNEAFWALIGYSVSRAPGREVPAWVQPLVIAMSGLGAYIWQNLKSPLEPRLEDLVREKKIDPKADGMYDGRVVLFIDELTGDLLVRVLVEPGNWGYGADDGVNTHALLAPTLQFSESNFVNHQRALRGELDPLGRRYNPIPLAEVLDRYADKTAWITANGNGGLELYKRVRMTWIPLDASARAQLEHAIHLSGDAGEDFCWVSRHVLAHVRDHGYVNNHLLAAMGLLV